MSKVLVLIGATGKKSGGAFTQRLGEHLDTVRDMFPDGIRVLVRPASDTAALDRLIPDAARFVGDAADGSLLRQAFQDADTVVHIAGIHWSRQVAEAAAACRVRRLILVHTTGIYSKYKAAGEAYRQIDDFVYETCREHGIALTILRPTMIYGNITDNTVIQFIRLVDRLPLTPVVSGGKYPLQPVHYQDLADAYYAVLTHEETTANRDFILSGGAPILLKDMLTEIGKRLGKRVRFVNCPFPVAYAGAWALYLATFAKKDFREKVQRLCEPRAFSHAEATAAFGYAPRTFQAGIAEEVRQYKEIFRP